MNRIISSFKDENLIPLENDFENRETNTLISDNITVICLDDYHINDREGRKITNRSALHIKENNFNLMYSQLLQLKSNKIINKPIYNHINGTIDKPETIKPKNMIIIEGLHPLHDKKIRDLIDLSIYIDITDEIKEKWKIERDMKDRGYSLENIKKSIEFRKKDFDKFVLPQIKHSDIIISISESKLNSNMLNVKLIQDTKNNNYKPVYFIDEESNSLLNPSKKLKINSYKSILYNKQKNILEIDGKFDNLENLINLENNLINLESNYKGELTDIMIKLAGTPGCLDGSGLLQTIISLKLRELYSNKKKFINI